jgi:P2-related tail formation protein
MKKSIKFLSIVVALLPLSVFADVMHYSICELKQGKSLADVQRWVDDWRPMAKKAGIDYSVRILIGHAAPAEVMPPNFIIAGTSTTLASYAKAWDWWYTDANAKKSNAQLIAVATCGASQVYTSLE